MLYLHGFCYFAVSFAIFGRSEFIKRNWSLSNICIICIRALTPVLSGVFKLTTSLESTVPERMSPISMSNKFDTSIKGSTSNQNVFSFYQYSKNLNITPTSVTFPTVLFLIPKKSKLVRDIINLLVPETAA